MRDLASLLALGLFVFGLYAVAGPTGETVRTARINSAVTLTAGR